MNGQTAETAEGAAERERLNGITATIVDAAVRVHQALGPGLLESAYEACLMYELAKAGHRVERQKPMGIVYDGHVIDCGYKLDLLVASSVVVELKTVEAFEPAHEAQLLSYLKLSGCKVGLLINFIVKRLRDGLKRMVNQF